MSKMINLEIPKAGPWAGTALDIFRGHWAYDIPIPGTKTGTMRTFHVKPSVLAMAQAAFADLADCETLELGPHEGEHSYHLSKAVHSVYAIEGRPANFLKCLIIKNELKLKNVKFAVGDFVHFLENTPKIWDFIYCTGVLYHMKDPAGVVELMARRCRRLALSTVVFDLENMKAADMSTAKDQFPTYWLKSINPEGYEHIAQSGNYTYYRRTFVDSELHVTMGHGNSHQLEANLVEADALQRMLIRLGGNLLYWKAECGPRGPMAYAAATFENL